MLKSSVQEYVKHREEENNLEKELEKIKKAEEMKQRRIATAEVKRFRDRVREHFVHAYTHTVSHL